MKLTDEMVEAAQDAVMRAMHTRNLSAWHPDTIRAALTAALSAAPPNADAAREVAAPAGGTDAVAAEREACARIADIWAATMPDYGPRANALAGAISFTGKQIAKAIRARGER